MAVSKRSQRMGKLADFLVVVGSGNDAQRVREGRSKVCVVTLQCMRELKGERRGIVLLWYL